MNKVINGRKYNTETATFVAWERFGDGNYDTLYRKRNGEFFIHKERTDCPNREWIKPVTEDDAKRFAEENLTGDEYEEIFGEVSEGDEIILLSNPQELGFFIDEELYPEAYQAGLQDLIERGYTDAEARKYLKHTPFQLELVYDKGYGFFAIEYGASINTDCKSPYSNKTLKMTDTY